MCCFSLFFSKLVAFAFWETYLVAEDIILIGSGQDVGLCMQTKELLLKWSSAFYEQLHLSSFALYKHCFHQSLLDGRKIEEFGVEIWALWWGIRFFITFSVWSFWEWPELPLDRYQTGLVKGKSAKPNTVVLRGGVWWSMMEHFKTYIAVAILHELSGPWTKQKKTTPQMGQ